MVLRAGFEPATFWMSTKCATTALTEHVTAEYWVIRNSAKNLSFAYAARAYSISFADIILLSLRHSPDGTPEVLSNPQSKPCQPHQKQTAQFSVLQSISRSLQFVFGGAGENRTPVLQTLNEIRFTFILSVS